ncbi:hypothetical protein BS78_09G238400 [Paspalum vaginatum]|nr:hypothetical protein BS78_09G238400 [Paspalum vaginatum]
MVPSAVSTTCLRKYLHRACKDRLFRFSILLVQQICTHRERAQSKSKAKPIRDWEEQKGFKILRQVAEVNREEGWCQLSREMETEPKFHVHYRIGRGDCVRAQWNFLVTHSHLINGIWNNLGKQTPEFLGTPVRASLQNAGWVMPQYFTITSCFHAGGD